MYELDVIADKSQQPPELRLWRVALNLYLMDALRYHKTGKCAPGDNDLYCAAALADIKGNCSQLKRICRFTEHEPDEIRRKFLRYVATHN